MNQKLQYQLDQKTNQKLLATL
uniref:Uncharacterized protein n=1 Tax=Arundo donax TaxID=35708 RepID=A0A0A9HA35_ARUDO